VLVAALVAFVRASSDRSPLEPLGVNFAVGDVLDPASVRAAFQAGNFDAAIATIAGLSVPDLDRQGNINVADAAVANRVQRVIFTIIRPGDLLGRPPLPYPLAP